MNARNCFFTLAFAILFPLQSVRAQSDRIQATVHRATINDILEKLRATKGLDQSGYVNLEHALPINYSIEFKKIWLDLDPAQNKATLSVNVQIASDFDFALFNYHYNEQFRFSVDGILSIDKAAGESAGSIRLCPTRTDLSYPQVWCLASDAPVNCAISSGIYNAVYSAVDNMKCLDITALGKVLPSIDLAVIKADEPIKIYSDRIGFGYTLKPYRIPVNLTPILSLLLE